jgi:hypothetical protein
MISHMFAVVYHALGFVVVAYVVCKADLSCVRSNPAPHTWRAAAQQRSAQLATANVAPDPALALTVSSGTVLPTAVCATPSVARIAAFAPRGNLARSASWRSLTASGSVGGIALAHLLREIGAPHNGCSSR